jgi:SecD/SecF fusion protein
MQNIVWKIVLIVAVLALCTWGLLSKEIRLGKDLRGGVSLIYRVSIPDDAGVSAEEIISQTISVLKDRVNPTGVLDISIQPLGQDRIEVVMPLPNEEVRGLNEAYKDGLADLMRESQIVPGELDLALQAGRAVERYCAGDPDNDRCAAITDVQEAYDAFKQAQQALSDAQDPDDAALARLEQAVADAEIEFEEQYEQVLDLSLERSRMVRALGLSTEAEPQRDASGAVQLDPVTGDRLMKSAPREVAISALKTEFPNVADRINAVVAAFDAYQLRRTGLDDVEDLKRLLRGAGVLEFHITVDPTTPEGVNTQDMEQQLAEVGPGNTDSTVAGWYPINDLKQWYDGPEQLAALESDPRQYFLAQNKLVNVYDGQYYMLVYTRPGKSITRRDGEWGIRRTFRSTDQLGRPAVAFELDASGGNLMARLTGRHVNEPMAIVLDGEVYSAPNLLSQIAKSGIITGNFADAEINYLIRVLAAGSLEARLSPEPIAVNTLGPSLGADNLARGREAFIIAIIAVAAFMLLYYFFAGFVADLALLANGLIIFGAMATIDGTFTLPGLAGIVLTIGMAVDANVLIYERIREEIFAGEDDIRTAIRLGYAKALSTIIDANVTNLIVCLVLFKTATAEVKGFALTLTIGIAATLFTALFVTRVIYTLYTDVFRARKLAMLPTVVPAIHRALEPSINWIGMRHIFWSISTVVVLASIVGVWSRGVDMFDTEFRGGATATMVTRPIDADDDGQADVDERGEIVRGWLAQVDVEQRVRAIGEAVDPTVESDPAEQQRLSILRELRNAQVLTSGRARAEEGRMVAQSFQIKVANPKGLPEEADITEVVVDAVVDEFRDDIDISPERTFAGLGDAAAPYVFTIEEDDLGLVVSQPDLAGRRVGEYLGGVAILLRDIEPPITVEEVSARLDRMRDQPDYRMTAGRQTSVVGWEPVDPADPDGRYRSAVVLVREPALSSMRVDSDVWYQQLAEPEYELVSAAMQRQSSLQQISAFSSAVAETLAANAVVAVILSLLGILIYIWVRFGSLRYSAAAIVALVHDVCIALGLLALSSFLSRTFFGSWLFVEEFRIDLGVVAALLTIIGYSLNDTIVILDRIRENRGKRPLASAEIVNRSINQTVSRTLLTSGTTLVAVLIMYAEGGSGIRPFTYCLLIGLVVGTYSSVAIAAPLVFRGGGTAGAPATGEVAAGDGPEVPAPVA